MPASLDPNASYLKRAANRLASDLVRWSRKDVSAYSVYNESCCSPCFLGIVLPVKVRWCEVFRAIKREFSVAPKGP